MFAVEMRSDAANTDVHKGFSGTSRTLINIGVN